MAPPGESARASERDHDILVAPRRHRLRRPRTLSETRAAACIFASWRASRCDATPRSCTQTAHASPTSSSKPALTDKPVVRKCIERIMSKTGLNLADANAVLRHMLRIDQLHKQMGPSRGEHRVVAPTSSFEEMVRSGEWKQSARSPLRVALSQPAPTSSTTSPTTSPPTSPPTTPRPEQAVVTRIPPDRHPAKVADQPSLRPDGNSCTDVSSSPASSCADGLMLLSTTAFAYAH